MFVLRQPVIAIGSSHLDHRVRTLVTLFTALYLDYTATVHWGCSLPPVFTEGITWVAEGKKGALW